MLFAAHVPWIHAVERLVEGNATVARERAETPLVLGEEGRAECSALWVWNIPQQRRSTNHLVPHERHHRRFGTRVVSFRDGRVGGPIVANRRTPESVPQALPGGQATRG